MFEVIVHVVMLYVGDAFQLLLFMLGLAAAVEYASKRQVARLFVEVTPRQLAVFLFGQMAVLLIALVGFKFVVLSGGPGIAVHAILRTGVFTRVFSAVSMGLAIVLAAVGIARLVRLVVRRLVLVRL